MGTPSEEMLLGGRWFMFQYTGVHHPTWRFALLCFAFVTLVVVLGGSGGVVVHCVVVQVMSSECAPPTGQRCARLLPAACFFRLPVPLPLAPPPPSLHFSTTPCLF